jgi:hypothetical protein
VERDFAVRWEERFGGEKGAKKIGWKAMITSLLEGRGTAQSDLVGPAWCALKRIGAGREHYDAVHKRRTR